MGIIYSIDRACAPRTVTMDVCNDSQARGKSQIHDVRYVAKHMIGPVSSRRN
jgi:hypothetical protein